VYEGTRRSFAHPDPRVTPLILDVTEPARVESLDLLINNAGIALYDDLSDGSVPEQHLAVNLFGPYRVTQAFEPLLTRSRGAVVNNVAVMALAHPAHRQQPAQPEGLAGVRLRSHLRRPGDRGGGHLPRSRRDVPAPGPDLSFRAISGPNLIATSDQLSPAADTPVKSHT
jgi:hypothetical protein